MKRVVVTGMGMVSPLGCGVGTSWDQLIDSQSGIRGIENFDVSDLACKIAGQIPLADGNGDSGKGLFNPDEWVDAKDRRKMDSFILYALTAATEAVEDSGWKPEREEDRERTGVMIGSGIGGLERIYDTSLILIEKGPRRVSPFFIPACLINLASGHVSIKYGFRGPNHAVVTACSSGAHAIGDAARLIQIGDADVMLAGGAEATVCRIGIAGFAAAKALSTSFNDAPEKASRPWDRDRDGFVMGEGSGIVVLEDYEHARARGAKVYAEILGYGMSGDAYHITAPAADGAGAYIAMRNAVNSSGLALEDIDYINAHGTSTPLGDEIEFQAVRRLFGDSAKALSMSSTKSAIGHMLGAAGSVEAIFSILALNNGVVPPTLNLDNPSQDCVGMDLVPKQAKERPVRHALSNSFGFGGTNASLIFGPAP